jgi:hypothetical protein
MESAERLSSQNRRDDKFAVAFVASMVVLFPLSIWNVLGFVPLDYAAE